MLCAEIQQEVYEIVRARAAKADDQQLASFVSSAAQRVLRSVGKSELAGFVAFFGQAEKEKFNHLLDETEITIGDTTTQSTIATMLRIGAVPR